jgi:hypothetical protein
MSHNHKKKLETNLVISDSGVSEDSSASTMVASFCLFCGWAETDTSAMAARGKQRQCRGKDPGSAGAVVVVIDVGELPQVLGGKEATVGRQIEGARLGLVKRSRGGRPERQNELGNNQLGSSGVDGVA